MILGAAVFVMFLAMVAPRPQRVVYLLCSGLIVGSRSFAYLYLPLGGFPLFVTDATLSLVTALLLLNALITGKIGSTRWRFPPALAMLLAIGVVAALRDFDGLNTGRNSVLLLYSLFFIVPVAFLRNFSQVDVAFRTFLVLSCCKAFLTMLAYAGLPIAFLPDLLTTSADVMWASLDIVALIAVVPMIHHPRRIAAWMGLLVCIWWVIQLEIRSAWTGLVAALLVLVYLMVRHRLVTIAHRRTIVLLSSVVVFAGILTWVSAPRYVDSKLAELSSLAQSTSFEATTSRSTNISVRWQMWEDIWIELSESPWTMLFGVGFGKPFLHRFSESISSPTHGPLSGGSIFSPHNSQWFLVYRIGFVGFFVYVAFILGVMRDCLRALRYADREQGLLLSVLVSSFVYVFVHSLTDVVLESPHRGVIYWFLLGICQAAALIVLRDRPPAGHAVASTHAS